MAEVVRSFPWDLRGFENNFFWKKDNVSSEEKVLASFSPNIECDKPQGTTYKGSQGFSTSSVEVKRSFF